MSRWWWWCVCRAALQAKRREQTLRNARSLAVRSVCPSRDQGEGRVQVQAQVQMQVSSCLLCSVKAIFRSIKLGDKKPRSGHDGADWFQQGRGRAGAARKSLIQVLTTSGYWSFAYHEKRTVMSTLPRPWNPACPTGVRVWGFAVTATCWRLSRLEVQRCFEPLARLASAATSPSSSSPDAREYEVSPVARISCCFRNPKLLCLQLFAAWHDRVAMCCTHSLRTCQRTLPKLSLAWPWDSAPASKVLMTKTAALMLMAAPRWRRPLLRMCPR